MTSLVYHSATVSLKAMLVSPAGIKHLYVS